MSWRTSRLCFASISAARSSNAPTVRAAAACGPERLPKSTVDAPRNESAAAFSAAAIAAALRRDHWWARAVLRGTRGSKHGPMRGYSRALGYCECCNRTNALPAHAHTARSCAAPPRAPRESADRPKQSARNGCGAMRQNQLYLRPAQTTGWKRKTTKRRTAAARLYGLHAAATDKQCRLPVASRSKLRYRSIVFSASVLSRFAVRYNGCARCALAR